MTLEDIQALDLREKNVCIVGMAASGKTFLSNNICNGTHRKIHGDDYIGQKYENAPYSILEAIKWPPYPYLIEGVQCFRVLRKSVEFGTELPQIIISCERPRIKRESTYILERNPEKLKKLQPFDLGLMKIWNDFLMECPKFNRPEILIWNNGF